MGGRIVAGTIQLLLALAGFGLVAVWMAGIGNEMYREIYELPAQARRFPWLGKAGFMLFAASWILAWFTSLSLVRNARPEEPAQPPPPVLPPPAN